MTPAMTSPQALPTRRYAAPMGAEIPAHWCRGDAAITHALNTYTLLVPDNEGFFIRTLGKCMPLLEDPALERQVHDFVRQEGQHGVGHRKAWKVLEDQGYSFMGFVKTVARCTYGPIEALLPLRLRTAIVAAVEHINAYIGREFLRHAMLEGANTEMRALFEWHFAEEVEHRSVAHDVLQKLWPQYWVRVLGAVLTFPLFYLLTTVGMLKLMRQDGSLWRVSTWKGLWAHLWSRDRMIQRTLRHIVNYLRPSFHPSQYPDDALARITLARWSDYVHDVVPAAVAGARVPSAMPAAAVAATAAAVVEAAPVETARASESVVAIAGARRLQLASAEASGHAAVAAPVRAMQAAAPVTGLASDYGFQSLRVVSDVASAVHWAFMHPKTATDDPQYRSCFHSALIGEICEYQHRLGSALRRDGGPQHEPLPHVVLASDADVFNLGGDLDLFSRLIRARDRDGLLAYATACVEGVYAFHAGLGAGVHSIALVQGDALGGGFEAALSCHTIVAEEGTGMGLPEVLFDLFPGMGAYAFLTRRVGEVQAERMMLSGDVYASEDLFRMGVVDVLVSRGQGEGAVMDVVRRNRRIPHARVAMHRVRESVAPVTLAELMRVTEIWVDTALMLKEKSLRTMERLVRAQVRRNGGAVAAAGTQMG